MANGDGSTSRIFFDPAKKFRFFRSRPNQIFLIPPEFFLLTLFFQGGWGGLPPNRKRSPNIFPGGSGGVPPRKAKGDPKFF